MNTNLSKNINALRALFYTLSIAFFFIPQFNTSLNQFDVNQLGEATLKAIDISSRVSDLYFFLALISVCFLSLNLFFSKIIKHQNPTVIPFEKSVLIAGCIQAVSAFFIPNLAVLLIIPIAFHLGLLTIQLLKFEPDNEVILTSVANSFILWLIIIWLSPVAFNALIHLFLLFSAFLVGLIFSCKNPHFNIAIITNSLSVLSLTPFVCTELNYFLREKIGFNINGIILSLILISIVALFAAFRIRKTESQKSTSALAWLFIACGMGLQTFYQPYGFASTEIFELANRATPLMELHFFQQIPLLHKASSHLVSDYGFGLIYQAIYGYHGLDFMAFDIFETLAWISLSFILIYQLTENKLAAFYFVVLFPFFDASITPYYVFAFAPLIFLIEAFNSNSKKSAWLFGVSFALLFPWRADLSFAILFSTSITIALGIYLKRLSYKFLIPTFVSLSILGILLLSIALVKQIDWLSSLKSTLDYLQSSQSYGLVNIGDQSSNQFILHHFILPILVIGVLFKSFKNALKSFSNEAIAIGITVIYLSVFYLVNLPRGIVRHGFAEGFDNFLDSYAPLIIIVWFAFKLFQTKSSRFWSVNIALCIFQLFLRYPNRSPENGLALAGIQNPFHHEKIPFKHQAKRLITDTANLQKNIIPMVNFLKENLKDGETFIDFGNTPMLYFYAEKQVPAFFYQSPQNVHSISLQKDWIERISAYKIPLFLFRHNPKEWWDATDGVPNEVRHYLIAEYAYQFYFPSQQVAGYEVWERKKDSQTSLPEFMEPRMYEYIDLKKLPAIWNPNLLDIQKAKLIADTSVIVESKGIKSILCQLNSQEKNWIILTIKNSTISTEQVRITLIHDIYPLGGYDFELNPDTLGTYKIRLSMLPSWWFNKINHIRISIPPNVIVEDVTFAGDSN